MEDVSSSKSPQRFNMDMYLRGKAPSTIQKNSSNVNEMKSNSIFGSYGVVSKGS